MIISPPFLPDRAALSEEAWLDAAMAQPISRLSNTNAPEGSFPLSLKLAWHNGLHIQSTQPAGAYLPVRAVADGEVAFVHAPTFPNTDVNHALNYNPFNNGMPSAVWTSDGMVVIKHKTEIGAAGTTPTEVVYYSACMHLSSIANCPRTNAPWTKGDKIYRKEEIGTPGQIYGHPGQIHFEICCDEANLHRLTTRGPDWVDPLAPMAPTKNGRTDSAFGSIYVYLPAGTPTRPTAPTSHLQGQRGTGGGGASAAFDHFPPNTLHAAQWVEIRYEKGSAHVRSYCATADTTSLVEVGDPIGSPNFETDFEYTLYTKAVERHNSLDAATQAASSPSGWYELLRFGRNMGADPLPTNAAHWREIPTATGTIWADLNASGTFKFSDADFLPVRGWNCFNDDSTPNDQRCDSLHLRTLIRDPDPQNERRMESAQLARRLGEATVRKKLRRAICQFPSEWDQTNIEARYGWLQTEDYRDTDDDATGAQKWNRFVKHAKAISFLDLPGDFLKADWRFHPREFVGHFRQCLWLSESEAIQLFPRTALRNAGAKGWVSEGVNPGRDTLHRHLALLNTTARKYCITTPGRLAAFYGNAMQETQWFGLLAENGGAATRYAPWFGRGFLQLTWPENYIEYAMFKGMSVSAQLKAQFVVAHRAVQSTRTGAAFMVLEGQVPADLRALRNAIASLDRPRDESSDSAGAYWAWSQAARSADPSASFVRATETTPHAVVTYYTHSSFGNVAATVNVGHPSTNYASIYGVQARFQAHVSAVLVLMDRERFPDARGQANDEPEGWARRAP